LRPSGLDHLGLGDTLRDAAATWAQTHPDVRWDFSLAGDLTNLGEEVNITVYRLVQEALTNVARHAQATHARISVARERVGAVEAVVVRVQDDGQGMGTGAAHAGERFGVVGMRERVQALGGTFEIDGTPGAGVTVRAVIPLAHGAAQVEA
jgi:hypothetical protein